MSSKTVSIGIPVFNEIENVNELISTLKLLIDSLNVRNIEFEIIINDNCSTDGTYEALHPYVASEKRIKINKLEKHLTFQQNIQNLMERSSMDGFVVFQSDLQDPLETLIQMIDLWMLTSKPVIAKVIARDEKKLVEFPRKIFYSAINYFSDETFVKGFQDFYLVTKNIYQEIAQLPSEGLFIRGYITSNFKDHLQVDYRRNSRKNGKSKFNFSKKYSLALDGILLYCQRLIRLIASLSFLVFVVSTLTSLTILILYLFGIHTNVKGWTSLSLLLTLTISIFGMSTGLILEYLIRIYRVLIFSVLKTKDNEKP